jgi:hypothetical protein
VNFGKKNSHILRKKIMDLMEENELSMDAQFMLYFFAALIKNKNRIQEAMKKLPEEFTNMAWYSELEAFVSQSMVQFPYEEDEEHFAMVHLPATNPPLTLMCLALSSDKESFTYEFFLNQQVTAQLALSEEVQLVQKMYMKDFWENQINKTSNKSNQKNFEKRLAKGDMFDEAIYKNQENDKYLLIGTDFRELVPKDLDVGYEKEELEGWMESMFTKKTKDNKKEKAAEKAKKAT